MIGEGPVLNESLPPALKEALDRALEPGEAPVISVRGQPREALVVTPGRLLTLREGDGIMGEAQVESYPLGEIGDVELREGSLEAALIWSAAGRAEPVSFVVPPYDVARYRMAAEAVRRMLPSARIAVSDSTTGPGVRSRCPKCSTPLPDPAAYCVACGLQVRDICWDCGQALETGWRFCPECGGDATEPGVIPCPSCREPVGRDQGYCVHCGAAARPTCDECDRVLRRAWRNCPDCGAPAPAAGTAQAAADPTMPAGRAPRREPSTPFPEPGDVRPAGGPPDAEALVERGIAAYEAERFDEAVALFRQAVDLDPDNAIYRCNLGVACGELGLGEQAFAEFQRALELDPLNARALVELGYFYSQQEQYEEARDYWERAIRAAPDSAEAGEARQSLENLEQL
jgi:hypothetical protein